MLLNCCLAHCESKPVPFHGANFHTRMTQSITRRDVNSARGSQSPNCTRAVDRSADRSLTNIRSAVVTHPPFAVSREQMHPNGFCSGFPEPARRTATLTRETLLASMCRYCAVFKAALRAHLAEISVRPVIRRTNPIIHMKKQNYSFAIDLAHISIAKLG